MTSAFLPANTSEQIELEACTLSGERKLPCGSVVTERDGRIISKISLFPKQW